MSFVLVALFGSSALAQTRRISGRVTTEGSGEPIPAATVQVVGTTYGAATDETGRFSVSAPDGPVTLRVRRIGYTPKTLAVSSGLSDVNISLSKDVLELDKQVITGTATTVASVNSANAVAVVSGERLNRVPAPTIDNALLAIPGLVLALAGLWLIFGQPWPGDGHATLGTAAVVVGMTTQALGLVWIKRLNVRISSLAITTGSLGVATPLLIGAWLVADAAQLPPDITLRAAKAIVYLGVLGSLVGFTLYYYVIKRLDAGRVALIMLVTPVAALLLGKVLNQEYIPALGWAGIALIGAGLLLYEWQALRGLRSASGTADNTPSP